MNLSERDNKIIWHPFTQAKTAGRVIPIKRASGAYIYDENDKRYLDLISSWWVNIHGHGNKRIAESIYEQSMKLEHVIFAGFTHEPAVKLCEGLQKILPDSLCKFFFSDNGSTAVEVAIKMAYQYWKNVGKSEKKIFLSFDGGYHGDTFGAMAVGAKSGFHDQFKDLFFTVLSVPYPDTWGGDDEVAEKELNAIKVLEEYLDQYGDNIAAIVLEPLIQGASGMRIARPEFIRKVIDIVRSFGILVIFDEVMTGFGRTGTFFALEQIGITPDFLCLSKGITGGFLPLALTVTTLDIYNAFLGNDFKVAFAHGHSYTANPIACAAAVTSLELLLEAKDSIDTINSLHVDGLDLLRSVVTRTRSIGTIAAFDVRQDIIPHLKIRFLDAGLLLRPLGSTIYLLPPYCISDDDLKQAYRTIFEIVDTTLSRA